MTEKECRPEDQFLWEVYWIETQATGASGDCTLLAWGDLLSDDRDDWYVAVIDGGRNHKDRAELKSVLTGEIGTWRIDFLIGTHTDRDHIGQFPALLADEELEIDRVIMRDAFAHLDVYPEYEPPIPEPHTASAGDFTKVAIARRLYEPEVGELFGGALRVLAPSTDFYRELLPSIFDLDVLMDQWERFGEETLAIEDAPLEPKLASARYTPPTPKAGSADFDLADETWSDDQLGSGTTSASNDASLILLFEAPDGKQILFTGDAGVRAFERAEASFDEFFKRERLAAFQLAHHAAWGNASTELFDRILGPTLGSQDAAETEAERLNRCCYASTGSSDRYHPSFRVTNAALRRGWHVIATLGTAHRKASPGFNRQNSRFTETINRVRFEPRPLN